MTKDGREDRATTCKRKRVPAAVTMEIYAQASSKATREALRRLGDKLDTDAL